MPIGESKELRTLLNAAKARIMWRKREEFLHWAGRGSRSCIQILSIRHTALRNSLLTVPIISMVGVKDLYVGFKSTMMCRFTNGKSISRLSIVHSPNWREITSSGAKPAVLIVSSNWPCTSNEILEINFLQGSERRRRWSSKLKKGSCPDCDIWSVFVCLLLLVSAVHQRTPRKIHCQGVYRFLLWILLHPP